MFIMNKVKIAVVGAGPSGLAALKNLREEGFNVTVFEKRDSVGGVWAYTDDINTTSTLFSTLSNISKYTNAYTDFPVPNDLPPHLTASQACEYLKSYASHFDLNRHVRLNTAVRWIKRSADNTRWLICVNGKIGEETFVFDKIVMCSGLAAKPLTPQFRGIEKFKGKIIHGQAFKNPIDFVDMKVVVVGLGNSAADTATELRWHASKVYLSHRHGATVLPRMCLGQPLDLGMTRQLYSLKTTLDKYLPTLSNFIMDYELTTLSRKIFRNQDPSWRLSPPPPTPNHHPTISDSLLSSFADGTVTSVDGLKQFINEDTVELIDGTQLTVDAVICCTGYEPDFSLIHSILPASSTNSTSDISASTHPRLYQRIFPPSYASSLAFMNTYLLSEGATFTADLVSMAISQIWKNPSLLPNLETMNAEIAMHDAWLSTLSVKGTMYSGIVNPGPWYEFLDQAAGTGVVRNLGYGWQGWNFWWRERRLCGIMMRGAMTPWVWRVFEGGGRRTWEGAREAIEGTEREVRALRECEKRKSFENKKD